MTSIFAGAWQAHHWARPFTQTFPGATRRGAQSLAMRIPRIANALRAVPALLLATTMLVRPMPVSAADPAPDRAVTARVDP